MAKQPTTTAPAKSAGQELLDATKAEQTTVTPPVTEPEVTETTTTTAPAPAVAETTTETPAPAAPDFLETLRGHGFQDIKDEQEARTRLLSAWQAEQERIKQLEQRVQEIEPLANYGREYLQTLRTTPQQQSPAAAAPAAESSSQWWSPPAVDVGLVQKYRQYNPETGQPEWSRETPAHVRATAEEYQAYIERWTNDLIYNPTKAFDAPVRAVVDAYLSEVLGVSPKELPERLDLSGERRLQEQLIVEYGDRMFPRHPVTNQLDYDRLTPFGEAVRAGLEEASQYPMPTQQRVKYALRLAEAQTGRAAPAASPQVQQQREQNRQDVIRRSGATGLPERSGTEATPTRKQNKHTSPGQELLATLNGSVT